ncbi:endonuclease [Streptomyces pactum]|uniref:Endonuclease n=1 Tax=Streptomyces pactum TaxID=68249 RepID=A0ABS0NSU1_9ACTN|nr:endonuclease [Streptomyces pactum]MBH5338272.1 endonuclease [Streptomyces pactum]
MARDARPTGPARHRRTVDALLDRCGRTYAADAGIRLKDTPQPLYQLLVLALLLSARIRASTAVDAARALFDDGLRSARRMADATWQQRVDALGRGHYRRYDERTSTQLGDGARFLLDTCRGDPRRLRERAGQDPRELSRLLQEVPGLGPTGADIFLREVQGVWPEVAPYIDAKATQGAERIGLPGDAEELGRLAGDRAPEVFAAALVRVALDRGLADEVAAAAGGED